VGSSSGKSACQAFGVDSAADLAQEHLTDTHARLVPQQANANANFYFSCYRCVLWSVAMKALSS